MQIAIIGTGIAGLASAWLLQQRHQVTVYEQNSYIGGHTNTVMVDDENGPLPVDTGFIVYNEQNYPNLTALFQHLSVSTQISSMTFSASVNHGWLEYAGTNLNTVFGQRSNLFKLRFYRMLQHILRFNREATAFLHNPSTCTLEEFLVQGNYSDYFQQYYLLPMGAAIWSCSTQQMLAFPAEIFIRFFHNHNLLTINGHHLWRTVSGGSYEYIKILTASFSKHIRLLTGVTAIQRDHNGVEILDTHGHRQRFDAVVLATHADQALALLSDAREDERRILGCFQYQSNRAVLHQDSDLMPRRRRVWSAWNYLSENNDKEALSVSVTYWMNRLQSLPTQQQYFVSLNPLHEPKRIVREFEYDHPLFTLEAMNAQSHLHTLQGVGHTWFCGSYCGYGFHEDALKSAISVAAQFDVSIPWSVQPNTLSN